MHNSNTKMLKEMADDNQKNIEYEQDIYKQFSQEANGRRIEADRMLEKATYVALRNKTTTNSSKQSTGYKRKQILALEKLAKDNACWFTNYQSVGVYLEQGGENEVYYNPFSKSVFKLNNFALVHDKKYHVSIVLNISQLLNLRMLGLD